MEKKKKRIERTLSVSLRSIMPLLHAPLYPQLPKAYKTQSPCKREKINNESIMTQQISPQFLSPFNPGKPKRVNKESSTLILLGRPCMFLFLIK